MNIHQARIDRLNAIEARDKDRFKPNPNGDGYLTRAERYQEARNECRRRMGAK